MPEVRLSTPDLLHFALNVASSSNPPHDQGRVLPAEAETCRHTGCHGIIACAVRHIIEIAIRVGSGLVDRRRQYAFLQG